jgi:hypothetical protein
MVVGGGGVEDNPSPRDNPRPRASTVWAGGVFFFTPLQFPRAVAGALLLSREQCAPSGWLSRLPTTPASESPRRRNVVGWRAEGDGAERAERRSGVDEGGVSRRGAEITWCRPL